MIDEWTAAQIKILTTGIYSSLEYPHRDLTAWLGM
jgi:hypothetical protein